MGLPLMIVYALHSPSRRWLYRILLGFVAFSIFLSISRSAILCGAVGMLVMALRWTWRMRFTALGLLAATFTLVYLTVPGLLGTITRLFTGISDDNSVASRTGSYAVAGQFIERSPWLGRGFGTFAPKYWILDNGYLTLLIEAGFLGLGALLLLLGTAAWSARAAVKRAPVELDREVAHALLAGICAGATAFAFFDMFAFPQTAGCFFLLVGLAGSMRRLTTTHRPAPVREEVAR